MHILTRCVNGKHLILVVVINILTLAGQYDSNVVNLTILVVNLKVYSVGVILNHPDTIYLSKP